MSLSVTAKKTAPLNDQQVAAYLHENLNFFDRHPGLLCDMQLPHQSGQAVSLIERQVALLRERNIDMRQRLATLLDNAHINNELFENTRQLVLDVLEAGSLTELTDALTRSLRHDFKTDFQCLCLLGDPAPVAPPAVRCVARDAALAAIGNLLTTRQAVCGVLRAAEVQFLFGEQAAAVGSAAVIPLQTERLIGVLAVGSKDPMHFQSGMGTLFLNYIAELLSRSLPHYLPAE